MKTICQTYTNKATGFLSCLHALKQTQEVESIHRMRVHIKKLRAISRFLYLDHSPEKQPDVFRKIFSLSGTLREIQLNRQGLHTYARTHKGLANYDQFLKEKEYTAAIAFKASLEEFKETALQKRVKEVKGACQHVSSRNLYLKGKTYTRKELSLIRKLLKKPGTEKRTHRIRRILRRMEPIISLSNQLKPSKSGQRLVRKIKETNRLLGNWHDEVVFRNSILSFLENKEPKTFPTLKNLLFAVTQDRDSALSKAKKHLSPLKKKTFLGLLE